MKYAALAALLLALSLPALAEDAGVPPTRLATATPVTPLDVAAGDVVASALSLIGTPYVYGGEDPDGGFDCSGLVNYVYNMAGYTEELPRSSQQLFDMHLKVVDRADIRAGDLLFFRIGHLRKGRVNHVAIYVGNGRFVHAPNSRSEVRLDEFDTAYWQKYFVGARRVLTHLGD